MVSNMLIYEYKFLHHSTQAFPFIVTFMTLGFGPI